jgi:hypothetical protein
MSDTLAAEISGPNPAYFSLWGLMKKMPDRIKAHTREELLHRTVDAAAYIREHIETIQRAENCCLERARVCSKNRVDICSSYKTCLVKFIYKFLWIILVYFSPEDNFKLRDDGPPLYLYILLEITSRITLWCVTDLLLNTLYNSFKIQQTCKTFNNLKRPLKMVWNVPKHAGLKVETDQL